MEIQNIPEHFPEVQLRLIEPGYRCSDSELRSHDTVYTFMQELLKTHNTECVCIITLGNDFKPINYAVVGIGNTNSCPFHVADIVKICLLSNASNCILVHNHLSSGKPTPSRTDDESAQKLFDLLHELQICLCDMVITSPTDCYSYMNEKRAPYDDMFTNYKPDLPLPDPPHITLTRYTNLSYARKMAELNKTSQTQSDLPFE